MDVARTTVTGWAVATIVAGTVAVGITGCGGNNGDDNKPASPSSSATTSGSVTGPSPAEPKDYSALLIKPSDIGGDYTAPQPPVLNPNNAAGVAQLFVNADNSRRLGDTILIVSDPASAAAGVDNSKTNYTSKVSGPWQPVDVGSNGTMASGKSPDNSQAITVLFFAEGKALVSLEFDTGPDDPTDPAVATDLARKQDAAIKSGLPS